MPPALRDFLTAVRARGRATVIAATQDEYGQDPDAASVVYRRLQRLTLLAYADGDILKYMCQEIPAEERAELLAAVSAQGFTVRERNRNLHDFGAATQ